MIYIGVSQSVIPLCYDIEISIEINIPIMWAYPTLPQYALGYAELNQNLETFMLEINMRFDETYQALSELTSVRE